MSFRFLAAAALAGGLLLSVSGAEAAPPVIDGKKVTSIPLKANGGLQSNDTESPLASTEAVDCKPPRCTKVPFQYKPAKGVKGGLMFSIAWENPASDFDLYVAEVDSKGRNTEIASCSFMGTRSAKAYVAQSQLRTGRTYVAVIGHFRSINDVATGKVQLTQTNSVPTTIPAKAEVLPFNCQL
jgi:hypothetical protein